MEAIFIDGNFPVKDSGCDYFCSPTCHPLQIGPDWLYGCTHQAWPQNRMGDFVPIVDCEGDPQKCEIPLNLLKRMIVGRKMRVKSAYAKARKYEAEIKELGIMAEKK